MLPKYETPRLTLARLSDDVMDAALESENLLHVSVQTAREVCYMYLSHTAVWDEELEQFQKESAEDLEDGIPVIDVVASLCRVVDNALMWEDIRSYRHELNEDEIRTAMQSCHIEASAKTMTYLLAAFVVGGKTALSEYEDILEEEHISEQDVKAVKEKLTAA